MRGRPPAAHIGMRRPQSFARRVALTAGMLGLALALGAPGGGMPAGAVAPSSDENVVSIHPALRQVGEARDAPPSTALCQAALHINCYGATQLQRAYNLPA